AYGPRLTNDSGHSISDIRQTASSPGGISAMVIHPYLPLRRDRPAPANSSVERLTTARVPGHTLLAASSRGSHELADIAAREKNSRAGAPPVPPDLTSLLEPYRKELTAHCYR